MKTCIKCNRHKPNARFSKSLLDGENICISCVSNKLHYENMKRAELLSEAENKIKSLPQLSDVLEDKHLKELHEHSDIISRLYDLLHPLEIEKISSVRLEKKMKEIAALATIRKGSVLSKAVIARFLRKYTENILSKYEKRHISLLSEMQDELNHIRFFWEKDLTSHQIDLIAQYVLLEKAKRRKAASELAKKRNKERTKTDIQFRLRRNLRTRLYSVLNGKTKVGSAVKDLGCSINQLKKHLEKQFKPGMSWDNYGNKPGQWSLDHKLPLSKFDLTDRKQFLKVCHFSNLQPMWHLENISKGNKITQRSINFSNGRQS